MDRTRLTPNFAYASQLLSDDHDGWRERPPSVYLAWSIRVETFFSRSKTHSPKCQSVKAIFFESGDHTSSAYRDGFFSMGIRRTVPAGAVCRCNSVSPDSSEK